MGCGSEKNRDGGACGDRYFHVHTIYGLVVCMEEGGAEVDVNPVPKGNQAFSFHLRPLALRE